MNVWFKWSLPLLLSVLMACDSKDDGVNESGDETSPPSSVGEQSEQAKTDDESHSAPEQQLNDLFVNARETLFQARPVAATLYGMAQKDVGDYYTSQLPDFTPESEAGFRQSLLQLSQQLTQLESAELSQQAKENKQVMANITRYFAGDPAFSIGYIDTWMGLSPFVINQINGPLIDVPRTMQNDQKITNEQEALDYIGRLAQFDQFVAGIEQKFEHDMAKGWIAPKVVLQGAHRYLNKFLKPEPARHPLMEEFKQKLNSLEDLTLEKKNILIDEAMRQMTQVVYPAYQGITEKVASAIDQGRDEDGIWAQPEGAAYYKDAIRQLGDSDLSPEAIHQIGLDEVARISKEMDQILTIQGYKKGSVGERMVSITHEGRFLYEDSKQGRANLLNDLNGYIDEINQKMPELFKTKPPYQVEVRAFPVEVQDGAPGGQYTPPAVDGSKPGIYWINLRDMTANPKFSLKTLTYHEANPGHHWQVALNLAQDDLPFLRRIAPYNAYVEGWALYSELVAKEMGMYHQDPFGDLGRLQAELFRAVRLVVDTGLHHKKWTREQAIDYMSKTTGSAKSDVVSEIERYMAWPGQALGYKLGMLKIVKLRQQAEKALGDKFDLAEFHDLILLGGAVPMTVLEQKINRWIDLKQKG